MNKQQVLKEYFTELGRKGGAKGGKARTDAMTPEERTALARLAASARWNKKPKKKAAKTGRAK
jgi:hypothetical protein